MPTVCPTCGHRSTTPTTVDEVVALVRDGADTVRQVAAALYGPGVTPADLERARRTLARAVNAGRLRTEQPSMGGIGGTIPVTYHPAQPTG